MCELCFLNPIYLGEIFPGFHLERARRDGSDPDGLKKGDWFLVRQNYPDLYWTTTPKIKSKEITQENKREWLHFFDSFGEEIESNNTSLDLGYKLLEAAKTKGFNPEAESFVSWFYDYLIDYLKTCEVISPPPEETVLEHHEADHPTDYTIGIK